MPAFLTDRKWLAVLLAVFMAVALSACGGGGGGGTAPMPDPEPMPPTAEEMCTDAGNHWVDGACMTPGEYTVHMTLASIAAAATAADAQAAYDAVKDQVTATQGEALQMAVDARAEELATMARADSQRQALMDAAGMIDTSDLSTQALVDAARAAIVGLRQAIADAVDVDDTSMYQTMLDNAVGAVDDAQDGIDTATRRTNQMAALSDASEALKGASNTLAGAQTRDNLEAAKAAQTALNEALDGAMDLTDAEKAEAQGVADAAAAQIDGAETAVAWAEAEAEEAARIVRQKAANAVSEQVAKAINSHTVAGDPPAEFAFTNTTTPANVLAISRISGPAKITPYQSAADKKTKRFTTATAPDAGTGWMGMTFTRSGTAAKKSYTEMAAVYTDIEEAKDALWDAHFATAANGIGARAANNGAVALTFVLGTDSEDAVRFTGGILPGAPASDDTATDRELADGASVSGTFYGVSGTFTCTSTGTDCVVSRDSKDNVTNTGTVTFTPTSYDALTTMAKYATPDADYTQFGYWMKSTKQRDGSYVHDIETFLGGSGAVAADLGLIEGTAKYYGAAAGVYVKRAGAGDSLVVTDGNFTADAMLTARFAGDKVAVSDQRMISGTISGFMDGSTDLGFADLTLEKADFEATAGTVTATFMGETNGGGTSGNWRGQFYGNAGTGTAADATDDYPQNVSGEFNGHFVDGQVVGAFGAEKD